MKPFIILAALMFSTLSFAQKVCDLTENDLKVQEVNDIFDRGEMRGEDHVISLMNLYTERLSLIADCLNKDITQGISNDELKDVIIEIEYKLSVYVKEMNQAIQEAVANDRIGMATQLTFQRDLEVAEKKLFIEKIKKLIQ